MNQRKTHLNKGLKNIWWQYLEEYLMTIFGLRWWRPPPVLWQCSLLQATRFVTRFFLQIIHGNYLPNSLHIASVTVETYLMFFPGIWVKAMERLPAQSVGEHRWWDCAERSCHCPTHGCSQQGDCREDPWNPGYWSSSHCRSSLKHLSPNKKIKKIVPQVMEVLQALVLKANLDAGTAEPSPVLAQVEKHLKNASF